MLRRTRTLLVASLAVLLAATTTAFAQFTPPTAPNDPAGQPDVPETLPPDPDAKEPEEDPPLPKFDEMELPSPEELVKGPRQDWIVLKTNEVIVVQPVYPRPDTLATMEKRLEEAAEVRPRSDKERELIKQQLEEWSHLIIMLPGDDVEEYQLHIDDISQVIHHEDLVLRRVTKLVESEDLRGAYELMFPLARRTPDWPGLDDVQNALLLAQARKRLGEKRSEEALVYIEELHDRDKRFRGLRDMMGKVFDALISAAVEQQDFRRARYFVARLKRRIADHDVVETWENDLNDRATAIAAEAKRAVDDGEHDRAADLAAEAALVWPATDGLRPLHRAATNRWQTLNVGVRRPGHVKYPWPVKTLAGRRHEGLVTTPLFEVAAVDYRTIYRNRDVESWEPTDLGRRITFSMRRDREDWESLAPLTASELAGSLQRRLEPESPIYDERLAGYVSSVRVDNPFRFEVAFHSTPLRPEALLAVTTPAQREDPADGDERGRFHVHEATDDTVAYRRSVPEPDTLRPTEFHVAEIVEHSYPTWEEAAQGLLREEVDLVTHVRPYDVDRLSGDKRFEIRRYALPRTHLLQFNWENAALRNQSFRRSLAFATNARRVMREVVLKSENSPYGRLVTAPWASNSLYYNRTIQQREHAFGLSIALRLAATKELKTLPELTLLVVGDDVAVTAAEEIVEDWRRTGIAAKVVTEQEYVTMSEPHWDVLYRTVKMTEPLVDVWPLLAPADTARVEDLELLPDWLRAQMVDLDRVTSWREAESRLRRLHADLHEDARYIPLWEIDDYYVLRNTLRPATSAETEVMSVYGDVERWIVRPPYPSEAK